MRFRGENEQQKTTVTTQREINSLPLTYQITRLTLWHKLQNGKNEAKNKQPNEYWGDSLGLQIPQPDSSSMQSGGNTANEVPTTKTKTKMQKYKGLSGSRNRGLSQSSSQDRIQVSNLRFTGV